MHRPPQSDTNPVANLNDHGPLTRPRSYKLLPLPFVALLLLVCHLRQLAAQSAPAAPARLAARFSVSTGGGETAPESKEGSSMVDIFSRAGASYEFIFLAAPYGSPSSALWIRDPPNGKGTHTTDPAAGWDAQSLAAID